MISSVLDDQILTKQPIGGGCIGTSYKLTGASGQSYFYKSYARQGVSIAEAEGLQELANSHTITVPHMYAVDETSLTMQYIEPRQSTKQAQKTLGMELARLHAIPQDSCGFKHNNFIGLSKQINTPVSNWTEFFLTNRLGYQIELAVKNGYGSQIAPAYTRALPVLHELLEVVQEPMSLLHGDLWGGNFLITEDSHPVLIDPAIYYGHREADLAMTHLFGGFTRDFYNGYNQEYPLLKGWKRRLSLYKLYHILNHLNLFGDSYLGQALSLLEEYQ